MSAWLRPLRGSYGCSIIVLIGHLAFTALAFAALCTLGWLASWALSYLDSVHKFPSDMYALSVRFEVAIFYVDLGLCAWVVLMGLVRFVKELSEESL